MKFNLEDKVIYTNDYGEDIPATIIAIEEEGGNTFYKIKNTIWHSKNKIQKW